MKLLINRRKAFTLIELLIVIAIIGILFIVLVSKVDFATDKAKATGVQTDFRSFQVAIELVAKENAGLATFGWDTGDTNGDRIRNSYDKGDTNQNGKQDPGEVFVGSKAYGETWTNIYTLTNPADANDKSAIVSLEEAINKNLDPKLHITIADDLTITMANGAQDPWKTEYHGIYLSNAATDNMDRGAIVIFSNGANQELGTKVKIEKGVVTAIVSLVDANTPDNNIQGKDDYVLAIVYTYTNGYGETATVTKGFSNNQTFLTGNSGSESGITTGNYECGHRRTDPGLHSKLLCGHYTCDDCGCVPASCGQEGHWSNDGKDHSVDQNCNKHDYVCMCNSWQIPENSEFKTSYKTYYEGDVVPCGYNPKMFDYYIHDGYKYQYQCASISGGDGWGGNETSYPGWGVIYLGEDASPPKILSTICNKPVTTMVYTFANKNFITSVPDIPDTITNMNGAFKNCSKITSILHLPDNVSNLEETFYNCKSLIKVIDLNKYESILSLSNTFYNCSSLEQLPLLPPNVQKLNSTFYNCISIKTIPTNFYIPENVSNMYGTFQNCRNLTGTLIIKTPIIYKQSNNVDVGTCLRCFDGVDFSKQKLYLNGHDNVNIDIIGRTGLHYCNVYSGMCANYNPESCRHLSNGASYIRPGYTFYDGSWIPDSVSVGDRFSFGDYEYCYGKVYYTNIGWQDMQNPDGWGVRIINRDKLIYEQILTNVNGQPITSLRGLFFNCNSITDMSYFIIPNTVTDTSSMFQMSSSLTKAPILTDNIENISYMFNGCSGLYGSTIVVNCTPTTFTHAFYYIDMSKITLGGSCDSNIKIEIANTGQYGDQVIIK